MGSVAPKHVGSSQIGYQTSVLALQGEFLTTEPPGKPQINYFLKMINAFYVQSKKSLSIFG